MNDRVLNAPRSPIRVFLFAEYELVLESLKRLIDSNRDMTVSRGMGVSVLNESEASLNGQFDVGVVYLSKSEQVRVVSRLLESDPQIRVVAVVDGSDLESPASALKLGAVGIVQNNQNAKFLIEAIRQTYAGETWLNQVLLHRILESNKSNRRKSPKYLPVDDADSLTARELQVIMMIAEGLNNKELAKHLNISEATVRHHLSSIYGKLGVQDRVNMVIFAHKKGLISYSS